MSNSTGPFLKDSGLYFMELELVGWLVGWLVS